VTSRLAGIALLLVSTTVEARPPLDDAAATALRAAVHPAGGRARLVHLWASWCGPCLAELPALVELLRPLRRRLDVVFVSLDAAEQAPAAARIVKQLGGIPGTSLRAVDDAGLALHELDPAWDGAIPTTYLLDANGRLAVAQRGNSDLAALRRAIDETAPARGAYSDARPTKRRRGE
jgi:thiol-disulfide isomerase/thioredoxin